MFSALLVGLLLIFVQRARQGEGLRPGEAAVGRQAPNFQLKDLDGRQVSLSELRGKIVMLDFWATWCGPCRRTMPVLEELQQEHPNDFTLLAVNLQEPMDLVIPYVKRQNLQSRVLLDLEGSVAMDYGAESIPMQVLIDQKGIVRFVWSGYYPGLKDDLWAEIVKLQ